MKLLRPLVIIASLLALLHAYIGFRLIPSFPLGHPIAAGVLVFSYLAMLVGMPARFLFRPALADPLNWVGSLMMGVFSSLLVLTVLRDVVLGASHFLVTASLQAEVRLFSALAVPALAILATVVGLFIARRTPPVIAVDVPLAHLPAALHGFRIAQISDIHVGPTIKRPYVEAIVRTVNALGADMVAITGDLVDGGVAELAAHVAPLSDLAARHGAYYVTGNHEYYSGATAWTNEVERLGIQVLSNRHVAINHDGALVTIAGVPDYSTPSPRSDPGAALAGAPAQSIKVLLAHQPRSAAEAAKAGFDLQLSGHTHGGQFWPWNHFVRLQQPFTAGLHRRNGLWVYVNRGTGYWGPPKRLGVTSEITLIRLVPAD